MARKSFREQMLKVREDAIVDSVNRLLASKGFELMTVDEVAADVGIAKASLYKHFASKEMLAAAAMVRVLTKANELIAECNADASRPARDKLIDIVRWAVGALLEGQMPLLPSQNSTLRSALIAHKPYMELLVQVSDDLGAWIADAQAQGTIDPSLPAELVLYTTFARACDPVATIMKASGAYTDAQIVDWIVHTCFDGLRGARAAPALASAPAGETVSTRVAQPAALS